MRGTSLDRTTLTAATWMVGSILSFSAMAVAARQVAGAHDTFEIMLYRSALGVVLVGGALAATGRLRAARTGLAGLHVARNAAHFAGQNLWFLALTMAPLAQVFALEFTAPLWVLLLAPLLLGERVRAAQFAVAGVGFGGILLVAQPWGGEASVGLAWAALAAVMFATTNLLTRRLTRTDGLGTILLWLTGTQLAFGLVCAGFDGRIAWPTAATAPWLALIGVGGLAAHLCLTRALTLAPASVVMPVDFARLPLIAAVGAAFYDEALDPLVLLGGLVIAGAAWANLRLAPPAPSVASVPPVIGETKASAR